MLQVVRRHNKHADFKCTNVFLAIIRRQLHPPPPKAGA